MARYIDADKVMEEIASVGGHGLSEWSTLGVKALIDRQPTADVAPRAEVAREIFNEITKMFFEKQRQYENSHQGGKANQMMVVRCAIYKLQKKYMEEKK